MDDENYDRILNKISRSSGLDKEEIDRRIEAKRGKLSGLISKDGAAQIIASELGISFDNERLKINELLPSMRKVNFLGKVINVSPVRTFTTKKGDPGKVVNLTLADETSNIKVVLWDINHIEMVEKNKINEGVTLEIINGSMRGNEVHLGSFSDLKISKDNLKDVKTEKIIKEKSISDLKVSDSAEVRAFIVQVFDPRFFYVCPECKKKVVQEGDGFVCAEHGKVIPEKRALINLVLDDGTESIRSVLFGDVLSKLGFDDLDNLDKVSIQKQELLGKEMIFFGDARTNKFFNNKELIVNDVQEINIDEIIADLEKN